MNRTFEVYVLKLCINKINFTLKLILKIMKQKKNVFKKIKSVIFHATTLCFLENAA